MRSSFTARITLGSLSTRTELETLVPERNKKSVSAVWEALKLSQSLRPI